MLLQENVAIGIIPEYFDRYYHVAINTYNFGTAIGIIVSPLLTQMFLDLYGWRGAMLMLCAWNMQAIPFGALLKDYKKEQSQPEEITTLLLFSQTVEDDKLTGTSEKYNSAMDVLRSFDVELLAYPPFLARVFLPALCMGYLLTSWLVYIVSFALSTGASLKESSIVATCGGIGIAIIRLALPYLNTIMTYKQLMYMGSFLKALSLICTSMFTSIYGMSAASLVVGIGIGILGSEIYVALKDTTNEDQYINGVSWFHLAFGFGSIIGAALTGTKNKIDIHSSNSRQLTYMRECVTPSNSS